MSPPEGGGYIDNGADSVAEVSVGIGSGISQFLVCTISCDPVVGFLLNFMGLKLGHDKELIRFW